MTGIHFEKFDTWFDVWVDGTVMGTVHVVAGGWVFYRAGKSRAAGHLPVAVSTNREDAVRLGLLVA